MDIKNKRDFILDFCENRHKTGGCVSCPLRGKDWSTPFLTPGLQCLHIPISPEEDLDRAIAIINDYRAGKGKKTDSVNRPAHYTDGKIEVIDYIEDKKLGFCLGNAVKYISRAGKKDPTKEVEDLKKAVWYINRRIKEIEEGAK